MNDIKYVIQASMAIKDQQLTAFIKDESDGYCIAGKWENTEQPLSICDILSTFGTDVSFLAPWDINIIGLKLSYFSKKGFDIELNSKTYGLLKFEHNGNKWLLDIKPQDKKFCFNSIPLVGAYFDADSGISIKDINISNSQNSAVSLTINILNNTFDISLPLDFFSNAPSPEIKWAGLNKKLGPVSLYRIGVGFDDGKIIFAIELGLEIAGLQVVLDGLSFQIPMSFNMEEIAIDLDGLEISFSSDFVSIGGGMVKIPGDEPIYGGKLAFKVGKFALTAYGMYQGHDDYANVFAYLLVKYPLGGPPAFFVDGLAAGLGFNYRLMLPNVKEVGDFELVKAARKTSSLKADAPLSQVLAALGKSIKSEKDSNFGCFGVSFTSFGLLSSFVLAGATISKDMEFSILGVSELSVPPKSDSPIVYCKIQLRSAFSTATGIFSLEAALGPESYILDKNCRLTGGLAAFFWSKGTHKDDFVISIGGYSDNYNKPAHYPAVDRLAVAWKISDHLSLTASAYLAITPAEIMAGGRFCLMYQNGPLSAWLKLSMDIYVSWKPLHYDFRARASIGVALRVDFLFVHHTFSIELSADIHIYGPEFSGEVKIHVFFVSFTIKFGDRNNTPPKLNWTDFKKDFMPVSGLLKLTPASGIVYDTEKALVMQPHNFMISVDFSIPATKICYQGAETDIATFSEKIGIKPMGVNEMTSLANISITLNGQIIPLDSFKIICQDNNVPSALWGGSNPLVKNALTGVDIGLSDYAMVGAKPDATGYYMLQVQELIEPQLAKNANTTDAFDPFEPVALRLVSSFKPPLQPGEYTLKVTQTITENKKPHTEHTEKTFHMAGDRFRLNPEVIHCMYPPAGARGNYADDLPNIVLNNPVLPWQDGVADLPSMALIAFPESCGAIISDISLEELQAPVPNIQKPEIKANPAIGETNDSRCLVIDIPKDVYVKYMPRKADLPFIAHVRQTPDDNKMSVDGVTGLSCVNAVSHPGSNENEVTYQVCLVSLVGHDQLLDSHAPSEAMVRMVLLAGWKFTQVHEAYDFASLAEQIDIGWFAENTDAYVNLKHQLNDGTTTEALYRGPLLPKTADVKPSQSYKSAHSLGRLLAMQDATFASTVLDWRSENISTMLTRFENSALGGMDAYAFLAEGVQAYLDKDSARNSPVFSAAPKSDNVAHDFMTYCKQANFNLDTDAPLEDAPHEKEINRWLASFDLLEKIPPAYLIPRHDLLPENSLRVFRMDQEWISALKQGALSVGCSTEIEEMHDQMNAGEFCTPANSETYGVLLRSPLVDIYKSLQICAYVKDDKDNDKMLTPLRLEQIMPGVVLALYNGPIAKIAVTLPPEELHYTVKNKKMRSTKTGEYRKKSFAVTDEDGVVSFSETAKKVSAKNSAMFALQMIRGSATGVYYVS